MIGKAVACRDNYMKMSTWNTTRDINRRELCCEGTKQGLICNEINTQIVQNMLSPDADYMKRVIHNFRDQCCHLVKN
jgi:hypothetical protein